VRFSGKGLTGNISGVRQQLVTSGAADISSLSEPKESHRTVSLLRESGKITVMYFFYEHKDEL
jgi:hypothetical protein